METETVLEKAERISRARSAAGRIGGGSKSRKKVRASKLNGKDGGRPPSKNGNRDGKEV